MKRFKESEILKTQEKEEWKKLGLGWIEDRIDDCVRLTDS